jgi:hypothetical protein
MKRSRAVIAAVLVITAPGGVVRADVVTDWNHGEIGASSFF